MEVTETGKTIAKTARDLDINDTLLGKWIRKYNNKMSIADAFPGKGKLAPYDKEKFELKKELARVTREVDIFKKKKKL